MWITFIRDITEGKLRGFMLAEKTGRGRYVLAANCAILTPDSPRGMSEALAHTLIRDIARADPVSKTEKERPVYLNWGGAETEGLYRFKKKFRDWCVSWLVTDRTKWLVQLKKSLFYHSLNSLMKKSARSAGPEEQSAGAVGDVCVRPVDAHSESRNEVEKKYQHSMIATCSTGVPIAA